MKGFIKEQSLNSTGRSAALFHFHSFMVLLKEEEEEEP